MGSTEASACREREAYAEMKWAGGAFYRINCVIFHQSKQRPVLHLSEAGHWLKCIKKCSNSFQPHIPTQLSRISGPGSTGTVSPFCKAETPAVSSFSATHGTPVEQTQLHLSASPHRGQRTCQRGLGACTQGAGSPTGPLSPRPRGRGHSPSAKDNGSDRAEMDWPGSGEEARAGQGPTLVGGGEGP